MVAKGDQLVLEAKFDGGPLTMKWLKDGVPLTKSANILIEQIDDQTFVRFVFSYRFSVHSLFSSITESFYPSFCVD